ncbi:MAG: M28 family peptidase [Aquificae bacterium]|nr:M28 family peptidase [Aquificota bacterium]
MVPPLEKVLKTAEYLSLHNRFPQTFHHLEVRNFLKEALAEVGKLGTQKFRYSLLKPLSGEVKSGLDLFKALPYSNSPAGEVSGELVDCGYGTPAELSNLYLKGKVALVREGKLPFRVKERLLAQKGAVGILVFREEVNDYFAGLSAGLLPVAALRKEDALRLEEFVKLKVETVPVKPKGENLWVEFGPEGRRETLTLIAHYDTKPFTKGAVDNAVSVALLLHLAQELAGAVRLPPYRVRILFTDAEEYGLLGAKAFVKLLDEEELKNSVVVSVDTVGWSTPAVLVGDGAGKNDESLADAVAAMLEYLGYRDRVVFTLGRSGRSDHVPFKKAGARTLFFASNPFPFRHTGLDRFEVVDGRAVALWFDFLRFFVKNFHRRGRFMA